MNSELAPDDDEMPYIPPSRWPQTFGVIAIVFALFGMLVSLFRIFQFSIYSSGLMSGAMKSGAIGGSKEANEMMGDRYGAMEKLAPKLLIADGLLMVVALVLLVGGVLLLMRRRIASRVIQSWAILKIVAGGFATYLGWQWMIAMQAGVIDEIAASSPSGSPSSMNVFAIILQVGYFLYFLWLVTLPILFLIWLNREVIKDDLKEGVWK